MSGKHRRTLVEVTEFTTDDPSGLAAILCVPAWDIERAATVPVERIRESGKVADIGVGMFLFCQARIGAEYASELDLRDFEHAPPPIPEDELFRLARES